MFIKAFGTFFLLSFVGGAAMYWLLAAITHRLFGHPFVFGSLYRMYLYHDQHPLQYIALVASLYSWSAAVWTVLWAESSGWRRWLQIGFVLMLALVASCALGGVLWKFHDMQAGYFPEAPRMAADFRWGASTGLVLGPVIVLLSFPLNVIALACAYFVTHKASRQLRSQARGA